MSLFDDVKQALNIREVIEYYGVKVSRNNTFCCPFHNEKHASASIKNDYFNCFACGAGGDLITFTAKLHGISNYEACKKLTTDFGLNIVQPQTQADRLRADRERVKRQAEQKREEEIEALIQRTGRILADYHCYLWQGKLAYPLEDKRHLRALHWLDYAQYLNSCYDEQPREFSINHREQVADIENRLLKWHHEDERI